MKVFLVVCMLSISVAAPISEDGQAEIVSYVNENDGQGNYEFSFETSNGISRSETGTVVNVGKPDEHLEVRGIYSYTDPEGQFVVINYTADENGYHVEEPPKIMVVSGSAGVSPGVVASLLG